MMKKKSAIGTNNNLLGKTAISRRSARKNLFHKFHYSQQQQKRRHRKHAPICDVFQPFPSKPNLINVTLWTFRNVPVTITLHLIVTLVVVGIGTAIEFEAGVFLIIWGTLFILVVGVRYTLIAYRIFTKGTPIVNGILIPIELIALLWASVATAVTGLYFIDPTVTKTRFITHAAFEAGENLYFVWWYVSMASITALSGTGYSSIIENNIATATIYGISIGLAYYSLAIILAYFVFYWSDMFQEKSDENREIQKYTKAISMAENSRFS